jgi:hypothetical protein
MNNTKLGFALGLGLIAAVPGCKKDKKDGEGGGGTAMPTDKAGGGGGSGPWAAWDMPGRKAAWQGAWVGPGNSLGSNLAYKVEGTKVTMWDGQKETTAELVLQSPCEAYIKESNPDGSTSGSVSHYTLEGGKLMTGLGDAGSKKGNSAIVCVSNTIFTLDDKGTCLEWERDMFDDTKVKSKPGTCSWGKDGDKDVFKATTNGMDEAVPVHGDAIYSDQIGETHLMKQTDWAAAKAARDAAK